VVLGQTTAPNAARDTRRTREAPKQVALVVLNPTTVNKATNLDTAPRAEIRIDTLHMLLLDRVQARHVRLLHRLHHRPHAHRMGQAGILLPIVPVQPVRSDLTLKTDTHEHVRLMGVPTRLAKRSTTADNTLLLTKTALKQPNHHRNCFTRLGGVWKRNLWASDGVCFEYIGVGDGWYLLSVRGKVRIRTFSPLTGRTVTNLKL